MTGTRCSSCGRTPAAYGVDFGDGQGPFLVCGACAELVTGGAGVRVFFLLPVGAR